jgi:hypothetical protein
VVWIPCLKIISGGFIEHSSACWTFAFFGLGFDIFWQLGRVDLAFLGRVRFARAEDFGYLLFWLEKLWPCPQIIS